MKVNFSKNYNLGGFFVFLITFSIFLIIAFLFLNSMKTVFEEKAVRVARQKAVSIINEATNKAFSDSIQTELYSINKDESGKITSLTTNSVEINRLKAKISADFEKITEQNRDVVVHIPIGSITNFSVLQGVGYRIPVKVHLNALSKLDFGEKFESVGINQTKHKIFMTAAVDMTVVSAAFVKGALVETEIPLMETVIIGEVPEVYGNNLGIVGR